MKLIFQIQYNHLEPLFSRAIETCYGTLRTLQVQDSIHCEHLNFLGSFSQYPVTFSFSIIYDISLFTDRDLPDPLDPLDLLDNLESLVLQEALDPVDPVDLLDHL